jgi:hypothetical protein
MRSCRACGPGWGSAATPLLLTEPKIEAFITRLGKRPAFLRPGIALERLWPWPDAEELDRRGALANEISDAITDVLTTLREPLAGAALLQATPTRLFASKDEASGPDEEISVDLQDPLRPYTGMDGVYIRPGPSWLRSPR